MPSFGADLKAEFDKLCKKTKGKIGEVALFRNLIAAFINLGGTYQISEIHGRRYLVEFDAKSTTPFYWRTTNTPCELGDILFVVTDGRKARVSVMQNKYDKRMATFTDKFEAQMNQLYLLKERPEFRHNRTKSRMLENAWMPSIGNYGVFRRTAYSYEMGYYSADCLWNPSTCPKPNSRRKIYLNSSKQYSKYGHDWQINYCGKIAEFGDSLVKMEIGQPYDIEDALKELNNIDIAIALRSMELAGGTAKEDNSIPFVTDPERPIITARNILVIKANTEAIERQ